MIDSLRLARNILLKTAIVTFVFSLIMAVATFSVWDTWTGLSASWFRTDRVVLGPLMLYFFAGVKFFAIFVLLAPALAIHWTIGSAKKTKDA